MNTPDNKRTVPDPPRSCEAGLMRGFRPGGSIPQKVLIPMGVLSLVALALLVFSISSGAYRISPADVARFVFTGRAGEVDATTISTLVFGIRLPRIAAAFLIGAGLSAAGASYQGLFRNSLVSPDILGASSGAGFGAALGLILGVNYLGVQALAFVFGLVAVGITCILGSAVGGSQGSLRLVLTGMVTGSLFVAGISVIKSVADPYDTLPAITFWLMGSLASVRWDDVWFLTPPVVIGGAILMALRWKLNAMAFSGEEAGAMGVPVRRVRVLTLISATLISSVTVAVGGLIGWVGLLVPHMARFWVGPNHRDLLPVSMLMGGVFLVAADDFARLLFRTEFPLSVITCVCGAPVFIMMLRRSGKGWVRDA